MFHFLGAACSFLSFSPSPSPLSLFSSRSVFIISTATQISPLCAKARFPLCIRIDKLPREDERERKKGGEREKKGASVCVCRVISVASTRTARTCPGLVSQSTKDYARLPVGASVCVCMRVSHAYIRTRDFLFRVHRM